MRNEELDAHTDHRFACNICFEQVSEPVVTRCGHLYCWACLFQWLEPGMNLEDREYLSNTSSSRGQAMNRSRRLCPVCKADCSVPTVIPIYVREEVPSTSEVEGASQDNQVDNVNDVDDVDCVEDIHEEIPAEVTASQPIHQPELNETTGLRRRRNENSLLRNSNDPLHEMNLHQVGGESYTSNEVPNRPRQPPPRSHVSDHVASGDVRNIDGSANVVLQLHTLISTLQSVHNNANQNTDRPLPSTTPSLHNRQLNRNGTSEWNAQSVAPAESAATELLSRVLLIVGSFVLLWLLVF